MIKLLLLFQLVTLADNTAKDLGPYTSTAPCQPNTITDYSGFKYDSLHQQMLGFGGGHSATARTDVDVFDFTTLKWASAYPSTQTADMTYANLDTVNGKWKTTNHPVARHTYDMMVVSSKTGELILLGRNNTGMLCTSVTSAQWVENIGKVAHYNILTKTWSYSTTADVLQWEFSLSAAENDPVSGKIVIQGQYGLWIYDPEARTMVREKSTTIAPLSYAQNLVYFPPLDKFYYITNSGLVWELTPNRAMWSQSTLLAVATTGTPPNASETGWAYDSVNKVIGGGVTSGNFSVFDPVTKVWTKQLMLRDASTVPTINIGSVAFHALDYDPTNNGFLFTTNSASGRRVWFYRYKNGVIIQPPVPIPPTDVGIQYSLSWTVSGGTIEVKGYRVYDNGVQIGATTDTKMIVRVSASGVHSFTVRAFNDAGESGDSNAVAVKL